MIVTTLAALSLASSASLPPTPRDDIVVVGRAITEARQSLDACLARHCPPNEDIDATLALAESQLVAGKYRDARSTLQHSLGRNKREADAYPVPVSDLYRANGKVAANLGYDDDYNRSTWGIYRTLRHGLPDAKDRHYSALMEVAEMLAATRNHQRARTLLRTDRRSGAQGRAARHRGPGGASHDHSPPAALHAREHGSEDRIFDRAADRSGPARGAAGPRPHRVREQGGGQGGRDRPRHRPARDQEADPGLCAAL